MFGNGMQKNKLPLIIVCDDKDMSIVHLSIPKASASQELEYS